MFEFGQLRCFSVGLYGWAIPRYSPDGELLETGRLPCANVTKLAFGGEDLRTAFVTTARNGLTPDQAALQPWRAACLPLKPACLD
jgi:D-xylonolactonase